MGGSAGMIIDADLLGRLEWIAAGLGVINIALLIFRSQWNFAFAIASVSLYIFVFFESGLLAESALQLFFIAANVWGWILWHRAARAGIDDSRVPVRWLDWRSRWVWLLAMAAISINLSWVMDKFTPAQVPYVDTPLAVFSIGAQFLLAYRRIENWVLWIAIDVVAIPLYIYRDLGPTAGLYGGFLVMSLIGLKEWIEVERRQRAVAFA